MSLIFPKCSFDISSILNDGYSLNFSLVFCCSWHAGKQDAVSQTLCFDFTQVWCRGRGEQNLQTHIDHETEDQGK